MASDSCLMKIRGVRLLDGCIKLRCEKLSNVCQVNKELHDCLVVLGWCKMMV